MGQNIDIIAYYENLTKGVGLENASVNITCISHPILANQPMTELSGGNYTYKFTPTSAGTFVFKVNASRLGFQYNETQFTILVRGNTQLVSYINGTQENYAELYFDEVFNITVFYNNTLTGDGIETARVNLTVLFNNSRYEMVNNSKGNYSWLFIASNWYKSTNLPFNFTMKINASAPSYQYSEIYIKIRIILKPSNISVYVNKTECYNFTMYYLENITITAFYYNLINNTGINGGAVYFNGTSMVETGVKGNYTINYHATNIGRFNYIINGSKIGYRYNETILIINVIKRPTNLTVSLNGTIYISPVNIYFDQNINITAYYNDTLIDKGISGANLNISVHDIYDQMTEINIVGNYSWLFNGTYWYTRYTLPHQYNLTINASLYGYESILKEFKINIVIKSANMSVYLNGTERAQWTILYGETVLVSAYYWDLIDSKGIGGASVNISGVPMTSSGIAGNYTYYFYGDQLGTHQFIINASKLGYNYNETTINITIIKRTTNLTLYLNSSIITEFTMYYNETLNITVKYFDLNYSIGIENAKVNITESSTIDLENMGNGIYRLFFNASILHNYTYILKADMYGYENKSLEFNITILERPTNLTIYVNSSLPTGMPIYYNETIIITARYNDTIRGTGIELASVNITYTIMETMTSAGNGNYTYTFKGTTISTFNFYINATRYGYKIAENTLNIQVIEYPTNLVLYINSTITNETMIYYNENLTIEVLYNNTYLGTGIPNANVTLNTTTELTGNSSGFYSYRFNGTILGDFYYVINASKYGYIGQTITFLIHVIRNPTNLVLYMNSTVQVNRTIYYNETLILEILFNNTYTREGISNANVKLNDTIALNGNGTGFYQYIFNGTNLGDFHYRINASKYGYINASLEFDIHVIERKTNITIYVNGSITNNWSIYYNETILITAYYNDTLRNEGIDGASVNITLNPTWVMNEVGNGNYTFIFNGTNTGTFNFTINATKYGFKYYETTLSIKVLEIPTQLITNLNTSQRIYFDEFINISGTFVDTYHHIGIDKESVNITILWNNTIEKMHYITNGSYYYLFNASIWGRYVSLPYNFTIFINATLYGYQKQNEVHYIQVDPIPTNSTVYLNNSRTNYYIIKANDTIGIVIYFEDILHSSPIINGLVNITCITNSMIANNAPMTPAGNGNYTWTFDPNSSGVYNFRVDSVKTGYTLNQSFFTIVVGYTNIVTYLNGTLLTTIDIYFDEIINITAFYNDTAIGQGIESASVNITVLWNDTRYQMAELGGGNYSWIFRAQDWYNKVDLPYEFNLLINASRPDKQYAEKTIKIRIIEKLTNITIYMNKSIEYNITCYYGTSVQITAYFEDLIDNIGIINAKVNISGIEMTEIGFGNYTWLFHANTLGLLNFKVNGTKHGYKYNETFISINVVSRPTNIIPYINGPSINETSIYFGESIIITAFYNDTYDGIGISNAKLNITLGLNTWSMSELGAGNYSWTLIGTQIGNFQYTINGTKYGFMSSEIKIIVHILEYPTNISIYVNNSLTFNYTLYYNQSCTITAFYNNTLNGTGIHGAELNISDEFSINSWKMQEIGNGNYTWTYNATQIGDFKFIINGSKYGFKFNKTIITIHVINYPTNYSVYINQCVLVNYTIYYNQSCRVSVQFNNTFDGSGIINATAMVNLGLDSWKMQEIGNGNYTWVFNATNIGIHYLTINISKYGYSTKLINITINVLKRLTKLTIKMNGSQVLEYSLYYNQSVIIDLNYTDLLTAQGLPNATVKLNSTSFKDLGNGIYRLKYNGTVVNNFTFIINATLNSNYESNITIIKIRVLSRPIKVELYINGELKEPEGLTLIMNLGETVKITVMYKDNITGRPVSGGNFYVDNKKIFENMSQPGRYDFNFTANFTGTHILNITIEIVGFKLTSIRFVINVPFKKVDWSWLIALIVLFVIIGSISISSYYVIKRGKPYIIYKKDRIEFIIKKFNRALNLRCIIITGSLEVEGKNKKKEISYIRCFEDPNKTGVKDEIRKLSGQKYQEISALKEIEIDEIDNIYADIGKVRIMILTKIYEDKEFKDNFIKACNDIKEVLDSKKLDYELFDDIFDLYFNLKLIYPFKLTNDQKRLSSISDKLNKLALKKIQEYINKSIKIPEHKIKYKTFTKNTEINNLVKRFNQLIGQYYRFPIPEDQFYITDILPILTSEKKTSLESILFSLIDFRNKGIIIPQFNKNFSFELESKHKEDFDKTDKKDTSDKLKETDEKESKEIKEKNTTEKRMNDQDELGTHDAIINKFKNLIETLPGKFISKTKIATKLNINEKTVEELAEKYGYKTTKTRVYKEKLSDHK
ncbi:MAG: hypothetical protein ACTSYZ_07750 [Candidatus Helarchaeota archaeon]